MARRPRALHPSLPLALLAALSLLSLGVRLAWLAQPCRAPCRSASDHLLIFDEDYYVNAARVIAGVHPPPGSPYADAPLGTDPNAEHPQLAKLIIAGSIELFGDGPFAWRLGSIVFGSIAILSMFALVRSAGGEQWPALGGAALMAFDNLLIVHSRIGTLDIYVLAAMLWAAVLYLRGRPVLAGAAIGVGSCFKLVAPYLLLVLVVLEALRWMVARRAPGPGSPAGRWRAPGPGSPAAGWRALGSPAGRWRAPGWRPLLLCVLSAAVVFMVLLGVLDQLARPYDDAAGKLITGGPFAHLSHMISYAAHQSSPHGPQGIASYPWEWLGDYRPIVYLNIDPAQPASGLSGISPPVHFLGMISPPVMLLALPALVLCAVRLIRSRGAELDRLGLAWFLGTFVPFELLSLFWGRTSYLYYMVIVMPGLYLLIARLIWSARSHRRLIGAWSLLVVVAAVVMYPLTPLP